MMNFPEREDQGHHPNENHQHQAHNPDFQNGIDLINEAEPVEPPSPMLNLIDDCLRHLIEYLPLNDLHSLSQTCKKMESLVTAFYQRNYRLTEKFSGNDSIYATCSGLGESEWHTQISPGFNQYINSISHIHEENEPLRYIQSHTHELTAVRHLCFERIMLTSTKVECIRDLLHTIEWIQIRDCRHHGFFYMFFLQYCTNMKRLHVQDDPGYLLNQSANPWLDKSYPQLVDLQLEPQRTMDPFKIDGLQEFFQRNPGVKRFSTTSACLWENRDILMQSTIELTILEVSDINDDIEHQCVELKSICELLQQCYEHGIYKRLHLRVNLFDQQCSERFKELKGLERLAISKFGEGCDLTVLNKLTELELPDGINGGNTEILARNTEKLKYLCVQNLSCNELCPFIRHSRRLLNVYAHLNGGTFNLPLLNTQRTNLLEARKVTIYASDNVFLATKWTYQNGTTDFSAIRLKRGAPKSHNSLLSEMLND